MAKKINGIWKIVIAIAGALITVGALCATIRSNEKRIDKVEVKAEQTQIDVVELKTDVKYIKSGIDDIKREIKNGPNR